MAGKLLLADDSVTVQRVIELTFADQGMQVISVGDGAKAIERAERDRPDIVLADVSMPERDGYEVARYIKRTPHLAHVPVILMTGAFEQVDEARARDAGCDAVLAKPFEPQMVIALVQQLLGQGTAARGEGAAETQAATAPQPISSSTASLDAYLEQLDDALSAATSPGRTAERPAETGEPPSERAAKGEGNVPSLSDAFSALLAEELGESPLPSAWGALAAGAAPRGAGRRPGAATSLDAASPITEEFLDEVARRIGDRLGLRISAQPAAVEPAAPPASPAPALPAITPEFVDAVAARVAERLTDASIRDLVSRHVLDVAERLVREEIERIKAGAK